jgi:hypothetical protein
MAKARLNIPASSIPLPQPLHAESEEEKVRRIRERTAYAYAATIIRFLKLYTAFKTYEDWSTVSGKLGNAAKSTASYVTNYLWAAKPIAAETTTTSEDDTPQAITLKNDALIRLILDTKTFEQYEKLLTDFRSFTIAACKSSRQTPWRSSFYFACIILIREAMKVLFPQQYQAKILTTRQEYIQAEETYTASFNRKHDPKADADRVNERLSMLVLLGDQAYYSIAFKPPSKLFDYLTEVTPTMVGDYNRDLSEQFEREDKLNPHNAVSFIFPAMPLQLQEYYARILLMHKDLKEFYLKFPEFHSTDMDQFVSAAVTDTFMLTTCNPLYTLYFPKDSSPVAKANIQQQQLQQQIEQQKLELMKMKQQVHGQGQEQGQAQGQQQQVQGQQVHGQQQQGQGQGQQQQQQGQGQGQQQVQGQQQEQRLEQQQGQELAQQAPNNAQAEQAERPLTDEEVILLASQQAQQEHNSPRLGQ